MTSVTRTPEKIHSMGLHQIPDSRVTPTDANPDQSSVSATSNNNNNNNKQTSNNNGTNTVKSDEPVRVVFLGAARVGKTSIIQRFLHNHFETKYNPTVEDVHAKKYVVRDNLVRLLLVDTSGSFDFPAMLRLCIAKASAFVIVFAHDNADSLMQASQLLNQIKAQRKDYAPIVSVTPHDQAQCTSSTCHSTNQNCSQFSSFSPSPPPITVVCNKSDLPPAHSQVSESAIIEWLLTNGLKPSQFVYSSAKTNDSISAIFKSLWSQNEVSQAIPLDSWDRARHMIPPRPQTPPSTSVNDFSAMNDAMTQGQGEGGLQPGGDCMMEKTSHKPRSSFLRSSLRLNRRSSSKSNKHRPDYVILECVLS